MHRSADVEPHLGRGEFFAKAKGRLRGKAPKLSAIQETHLVGLYRAGKHTTAELAELFSVGRSTIYRAVQRAGEPAIAVSQK